MKINRKITVALIREVNRSGAQLLGVEQQQLTDRPFAHFIADPEKGITMPRKILIVEDNAKNRSLFRDILTFHGYEVFEAVDGQDGVDQARKLMPDLILMDIQMPGMDGLTAGSILKGDPATATLKIIALTSFAMQGDREKFLEAGFDGYLSKPINTRELPGLILHWLDGGGTTMPVKPLDPTEISNVAESFTIPLDREVPV
jgi:two-component system, cell cycle response regulator DivK